MKTMHGIFKEPGRQAIRREFEDWHSAVQSVMNSGLDGIQGVSTSETTTLWYCLEASAGGCAPNIYLGDFNEDSIVYGRLVVTWLKSGDNDEYEDMPEALGDAIIAFLNKHKCPANMKPPKPKITWPDDQYRDKALEVLRYTQ